MRKKNYYSNLIDTAINDEINRQKYVVSFIKKFLTELEINKAGIEELEYKRLHKKAKYTYRAVREYENKLRRLCEVNEDEN